MDFALHSIEQDNLSTPEEDLTIDRLLALYKSESLPAFDTLVKCHLPVLEDSVVLIYNNHSPHNDNTRVFFRKLLYAYLSLIKDQPDFSSEAFGDLTGLFNSVSLKESPELTYLKTCFLNPWHYVHIPYNASKDTLEYYTEYALLQDNYPELIQETLAYICAKSFDKKNGISPELFVDLKKNAIIDLIKTAALTDYPRFSTLIPLFDEFFLSEQLDPLFWLFIIRQLMIVDFPQVPQLCRKFSKRDDLPYCSYLNDLYRGNILNALPIQSPVDLYNLYKEQIEKEPKSQSCALVDFFRVAIHYQNCSTIECFVFSYYQENGDAASLFNHLKMALIREEVTSNAKKFIAKCALLISEQETEHRFPMLRELLKYLVCLSYLHPALPFVYDYRQTVKQYFLITDKVVSDYINFPSILKDIGSTLEALKHTRFDFFGNAKISHITLEEANPFDWRLLYTVSNPLYPKAKHFVPKEHFSDFFKTCIIEIGLPPDDYWKKLVLGFFKNEEETLTDIYDCFEPAFKTPLINEWVGLAFDLYLEHGTPSLKFFLEKTFDRLSILIKEEKQYPMSKRDLSSWLVDLGKTVYDIKPKFIKIFRNQEYRGRYKTLQDFFFDRPDLQTDLTFHEELLYEAQIKQVQENEASLLRELEECKAEPEKEKSGKQKKKKAKSKKKSHATAPQAAPASSDTSEPNITPCNLPEAPTPVLLHQYAPKPLNVKPPKSSVAPEKIQRPFVYPHDYQVLGSLLYAAKQHNLPESHPYASMAKTIEAGLQEALQPFEHQGASLKELQEIVCAKHNNILEDGNPTLSWFLALEKVLKKLPDRDSHTRLKSILRGRDSTLYLPASLDVLPDKQARIIQLIWGLAANLYQDNTEHMALVLYGSTSRAWLENALQLPLSGEPHDLDFSIQGAEEHWQFSHWIEQLEQHPDFALGTIKKSAHQGYAQISFLYQGTEIELNFHKQAPPVLGSFAARVILPFTAQIPQFLLAQNAILHFQRRKVVIDTIHFNNFLNQSSLHFLLKELCLRTNEGWKLSQSTAQLIESDACQNLLLSQDADRSICIFLSQYLKKNPAAFLNYFKEADHTYHVLIVWMRAFGLHQMHQEKLHAHIVEISCDNRVDPLQKNIAIVNVCLSLLFTQATQVPNLSGRFMRIVLNLEKHLGTLGLEYFFEPRGPESAPRPRFK